MARTFVTVAAVLASLAAGRVHAQAVDRRPAVEVVLDNRAPAAATEIAAAQARVRFIFREAGIHVAWMGRTTEPFPELGGDRIVLVLLDLSDANRVITGDPTRLGFAVPPANRVYVHYPRVAALARERGVQPGWFLGVVVAHELGHVLLPRAGHAEAGIMAPSLAPDSRFVPVFSREEGRDLRARLAGETLMALK
jgi:hypothetical protein